MLEPLSDALFSLGPQHLTAQFAKQIKQNTIEL